ncbi:hypothetical protein LCGC14_2325720, partial [marine sediment metagenome]
IDKDEETLKDLRNEDIQQRVDFVVLFSALALFYGNLCQLKS